jgi:hypothetical protein
MGVVDQAVEDGVGVSRVSDHLMPFIDGDLAGENGRAAAVAFFEDLVEISAGARSASITTSRSRRTSTACLTASPAARLRCG